MQMASTFVFAHDRGEEQSDCLVSCDFYQQRDVSLFVNNRAATLVGKAGKYAIRTSAGANGGNRDPFSFKHGLRSFR
jgi:hypothetical protein